MEVKKDFHEKLTYPIGGLDRNAPHNSNCDYEQYCRVRSANSVGISQYLKYRNIGETSIFFNSNRNFPNLNRKKWNNRQYIVLELFYRTTFFRNGSLSRKMKLFAVYRTHPVEFRDRIKFRVLFFVSACKFTFLRFTKLSREPGTVWSCRKPSVGLVAHDVAQRSIQHVFKSSSSSDVSHSTITALHLRIINFFL